MWKVGKRDLWEGLGWNTRSCKSRFPAFERHHTFLEDIGRGLDGNQ